MSATRPPRGRWRLGLLASALLTACGGASPVERGAARPEPARPAASASVDVDPEALEVYWRLVAERNVRQSEPFLALFADPVRCFDGRADVPLDTLRAELGERLTGIEYRPVDVHAATLADGSVRVVEWVAHVRAWDQPVRVEPRSVRLVRVDGSWRVTAEHRVGADCGAGEHLAALEVPAPVEACIDEAGAFCGAGGATQQCWLVLQHCVGGGAGVSEVDIGGASMGFGLRPAAGDCAPSGWCVVAPSNGLRPMRAVAGRAADDVYAGGGFGLAHFDGAAWSHVEEVDMEVDAAVAREDGALWFLGRAGTELRFAHVTRDGMWTSGPLPTTSGGPVHGLHAAGDDSVWAVGRRGLALRWDGAAWAELPRLTDRSLRGAVSMPEGLLVYGGRGTLLSFDGARWRPAHVPGGPTFFASAVVDGETSLFGAREPSPAVPRGERTRESTRYVRAADGTLRAAETIPDHVYDLARTSDGLIAVGAAGAWRRAGDEWVRETPDGPLRGIWAEGSHAVAVGDRGAWVRRDGAWTNMGAATVATVAHVVGERPDDVYAVSSDAVRHWDGARWRAIAEVPAPLPRRVAAIAPDGDLLLMEGIRTASFDGTRWTRREHVDGVQIERVQRIEDELYAVATFDRDGAHARGLYRWREATGWEQTAILPAGDVHAILGPTSVYATVEGADYRHFLVRLDGARRRVLREVDGSLDAFWARGRRIVLVIDDRTLVFDGRRWRTTAADSNAPYSPRRPLVGAAPDALYGESHGMVVRFDGHAWSNEALPTRIGVSSVAWIDDEAWAGAADGVVLRWRAPAE